MSVGRDRVERISTRIDDLVLTLPSEIVESRDPFVLRLRRAEEALRLKNLSTRSLESLYRLRRGVYEARSESRPESLASDATSELLWIFESRCVIAIYMLAIDSLIEQTLPLSTDIFYWNDTLSHDVYCLLYAVQSLPKRILPIFRAVFDHCKTQISHRAYYVDFSVMKSRVFSQITLSEQAMKRIHFRVTAPTLTGFVKAEIRSKITALERLREAQAMVLGYIVSECFQDCENLENEWKSDMVINSQKLIRAIECLNEQGSSLLIGDEQTLSEENLVSVPDVEITLSSLAENLHVLGSSVWPFQKKRTRELLASYGRPGIITRYWPFAVVGITTGSSIMKFLFDKRMELRQWALEAVDTALDFWRNWIVEPIIQIIGVIRHDDQSEIALMGKQSLITDMQSLERMVIDFAMDNSQYIAPGTSLDAIRASVKEGDLSPVLRSYEDSLQTPIRSTISGELIRTFLIQIQKTKVDVEVALSGIDRLLKSQQLVFGFVGVTPSLLLIAVAYRWLWTRSTTRNVSASKSKGRAIAHTLRAIERILLLYQRPYKQGFSKFASSNELSYKAQGLILCHVRVLQEYANGMDPSSRADFLEDLLDLSNMKLKIDKRLRTAERMWRTL